MKRQVFTFLLTVIISMIGIIAYAAKVDGIYYDFSGTEAIVTYYNYDSYSNRVAYSGDVVIPESVSYNGTTYNVTRIGLRAFIGCWGLTSVTIPNGVTRIDNHAFSDCSGLKNVNIPNSVNRIESSAFSNCSGLTSVTIPNSVTKIEEYTFNGCSGLTSFTIFDTVTSIGQYAFYGCSGLTCLTIPNSVKYIGYSAFGECSGLTEVNFNATNCETMGSDNYPVFKGCTSFTTLNIGNNVKNIPNCAFMGCSGLTNLTIPNSVTRIGWMGFYGCSGLTKLTIPNSVTTIGGSAFYGCRLTEVNYYATNCISMGSKDSPVFSNCTSLKIGEDVKNIPAYAFIGLSRLTSVIIPNSVTSIGYYAFSGCTGLTSVTIPNSVTNIGDYAFSGCSLNSVTIGAGVLSIGSKVFYNNTPAKVIWLTNTPPSGYNNATGTVNYVANDLYTSLSNKTLYKFLSSMFEVDGIKYVPVSPSERTCDAIDCTYDSTNENIIIGGTVEYKGVQMKVSQVHPYACYNNQHVKDVKISCSGDVGNYAFRECKELATVELSNGGAIGNYAFTNCSKLSEAEISNTGAIEDYTFQSCTSLQSTTLGEQVTGIGQYAFTGCSKLQGIVIPDAVKTVGQYAFQNCSSMESVKMGTGVETIETYTFTGCSALTDMQIGSNVKSINTYAFNNCSSLPLIEILQSVTKINNCVFYGCKALKNVYIADRTTELTLGCNGIGNSSYEGKPLFSDCPLDSVYIGGNITYNTSKQYGYSPFYRNTSLRSVHITDQETEISDNEFYGCTGLKNVRIGDGVTTISNRAFSGCSSLDYFQFGASVETIGQEAFSDCVAVTKVISRAPTPPTCGSQALDDLNKWECQLEVPEGMAGAYQEADQWKEFFFVEEGDAAVTWHKLIYEVDGETFKTVNVAAGAAITPEQAPEKTGFTFAGWTGLPTTMPSHDVTVTARYILAGSDDMSTRGDLNNDGFVNMADVTKLIDYILGRTQ